MSKLVQIYDFKTKTLSTIPAAELAPGMVEAEVIGVGRVWVPTSGAQESDHRHPPFTGEIRDLILKLKEQLADVYPKTYEEWEDGFRKDTHPEREIAIWFHIASVFIQCTSTRGLSPQRKREYFRLVVNCSMSPRAEVLQITQLETITRKEAARVIETYFAPQPPVPE